MRFSFSDEQEELRRTVRRVLTSHIDHAARHTALLAGEGYDPVLWQVLATELGLSGLIVPERHGGVGLGYVELAAVMEELGNHLASVPFFSTVGLATTALLTCGDDAQQAAWLPGIAAGETRATLAWVGHVEATPAGDEVVLSGTLRHVVDGHLADVIIAVAAGDLYVVAADAAGLACERLPTVDLTRPLAELRFTQVRVPTSARMSGDKLPRVFELASIALAAEQVGGAQRCVDMSVDYAGVRTQFGKPIGSFQAVQHMCADMFLQLESARSAAYYAAWVADSRPEEMSAAAATAAAYCGDAFAACAGQTIQVHGGIGFTWEHDAHLYFKRARASRGLIDAPGERLERIAHMIGLGPSAEA